MRYFLIVIAYFFVFLCACSGQKESPPSAAKQKLSSQLDERAIFSIKIDNPDAYSVGQKGSFAFVLAPAGAYHINQEYPTSVTVSAPKEILLTKEKLLKSDAATFGEKSARFEIAFSSSTPGNFPVQLKALFAMCTEESCIPFDKTFAVVLSIK
jgi:hypothetical protein